MFLVPRRRCKPPQAKLFTSILSWQRTLMSFAASKGTWKPQQLCLSFDYLPYFVLWWQKRKILSYQRIALWVNPHPPVSGWGSRRAGWSWEGHLWLHSKQQQGRVRSMRGTQHTEKESFPEMHFQLSNWMEKSFKSTVRRISQQTLAVSFQGFLGEHQHLFQLLSWGAIIKNT